MKGDPCPNCGRTLMAMDIAMGVCARCGHALRDSQASAGDDLPTADAEAYPVGSPKWLALTDADVDAQRDRVRGK